MAKRTVAVFDDSEEYIGRLAEYVNRKKDLAFDLIGFWDADALAHYLEETRIDILLFSMERLLEESENREEEYDRFLGHENVREFIYFGERRNSRTSLRHINKYQSAGKILSELQKILQESDVLSDKSGSPGDPEGAGLVGIYAPGGESEASMTALRIAEQRSAKAQVLFIDMDRFSMVADYLQISPKGGISDLIFYYKTNSRKLSSCLKEKKRRYNNLDFINGPENMEDIDELAESDWPDFLRALAKSGSYDEIVIYMAEAFRNLETFFDACRTIYTLMTTEPVSARKMEHFTENLCGRGRRDLIERTERICIRKGEAGWSLQRN